MCERVCVPCSSPWEVSSSSDLQITSDSSCRKRRSVSQWRGFFVCFVFCFCFKGIQAKKKKERKRKKVRWWRTERARVCSRRSPRACRAIVAGARCLSECKALRICLSSGACLPYIPPAACMANEMQMSSPPIWLELSQRSHFSKPSSQWIAKWSVSCKMCNPPPPPLPPPLRLSQNGLIYIPANVVTSRIPLLLRGDGNTPSATQGQGASRALRGLQLCAKHRSARYSDLGTHYISFSFKGGGGGVGVTHGRNLMLSNSHYLPLDIIRMIKAGGGDRHQCVVASRAGTWCSFPLLKTTPRSGAC